MPFKNIFIRVLLFLSFIQTTAYPIFAQTDTNSDSIIVINRFNELQLMGEKIYFLEDVEGSLSIEDILKPETQALFKKDGKRIFQRPPTDKTYWLKLSVRNLSKEDIYIELGTEFMKYLDYYAEDKGKYGLQYETGFMKPDKNRPYPVENLYWFKLEKKEQPQTVYIRVFGEGLMEIPIQIGTLAQLYENKIYNDSIFYAFTGLIIAMFGYNFFLFITIGDRIYAVYLGYIFWAFFTIPFLNNYHFVTYLFGEAFRPYWYLYHSLWVNNLFLFVGLFAIRFLKLRITFPLAYFISIGFIIVFSILLPIVELLHLLPAYITTGTFMASIFGFSIFLIATSFYMWIVKRQRQARFYNLAWIWLIASVFITLFTMNDLLPYNSLTRNSSFFGFSLEILFFSLALGDRMSRIRKDHLAIIEKQKDELEVKVMERTNQLKESNEELQQANEEIQVNNEVLVEQNKEITDSINYAQRIQLAMLPTLESMQAHIPELFVLFRPRNIVSGDFYYFAEKNGYLVMAAVDCTGHGVPGAFMSMIGNDILNNLVEVLGITEADKILDELHKGIRQVLKQKETENRDGMDVSLIVIDFQKGLVEYAGARNPLLYMQEGVIFEIKANKLSIGGEQRELERKYTKHIIPIKKEGVEKIETTFYLFTDGYQDQFGGREKKKFMISRMKELLLEIHQQPMEEQRHILNQEIQYWMIDGRERQIDDILMMGVRV